MLRAFKSVAMLARIALLGALLFATACGARSSAKIKINVRQSDEAIRQQLLQLTPPGTPAKEVYQFLQHRLWRYPGTSVSGAAPGEPFESFMKTHDSFMIIDLGHYYQPMDVFCLFLCSTVVQAFWDFDENDRLVNIRIRRFHTGP